MNPLTISKTDNNEARMTTDSARQSAVSTVSESQRDNAQQCHNGVCMVAWKPTKPQAA